MKTNGFADLEGARRHARTLNNNSGIGFDDIDAARRQARARRVEVMRELIVRATDDKSQIVRHLVQLHHNKVLALIGEGFPLCRDTIDRGFEIVAISYANSGDVTQDDISESRKLSFQLFEAARGLDRQFRSPYRPSIRDAAEREYWRRLRHTSPSNQRPAMNMRRRTIDKVRAALCQDIRVGHVYLASLAFCGVVWSVIGLLAIGGGR